MAVDERQAEVIVEEKGATTGTAGRAASRTPDADLAPDADLVPVAELGPDVDLGPDADLVPVAELAPAGQRAPAGMTPADPAPVRAPAKTLTAVDRSQLPSWRGWIHAVAFVLSIPLGVALLLLAGPAEARAAAAVYVVTLVVGFGTSAAYHRLARGPRALRWMRRADHSSIYLLIAGTYTPICLLALPAPWGLPVLAVVWVGAIVGVILKLTAFDRTRVAGWALYMVLGWAAIIAMPALVRHLTPLEITLIVAGGLIYTGGSIVLATGRPDPIPSVFGYHEVWHACTVLAGLCNFASIGLVVAAA